MSKVTKKINDIFKDHGEDKDFDEVHFTNESRMTMEDFTPEEAQEVEDAVDKMRDRHPQKKWNWSFSGRMLFKAILLLVEMVILVAISMFVLPIAINTDVGIIQSASISAILTYLRFWWR